MSDLRIVRAELRYHVKIKLIPRYAI